MSATEFKRERDESSSDSFFSARTQPKSVLIGGIPRSGTTMVAALIGQRGDTFVWPGETWVLPNIAKLWAGGPPNPACRAQIVDVTRRALKKALLNMREWNDTYAEPSVERYATARELDELGESLADLALGAPSPAAALRAGASVLEQFQRRWSDKPFVAEKTPENVLLFPELSRSLDPVWVVCHREPFAVIASLQKRAGADPFAPWDGTIETCIGMYLKYGTAVASAVRATFPALSVGYDEVCADPERVMARLSVRLGGRPQQGAESIHSLRTDAWREFSPEERWVILALTGGVRELLGYGQEAFSESFSGMVEGALRLPEFAAAPLMGASIEPGQTLRWLEKHSAHAVFCSSPVSRLEVDLYNPPGLNIDFQRLSVLDCTGRVIASIALRSGEQATLGIETACLRASAARKHVGSVYLVEMRAERVCVPYATIPGSLDERPLSLMASDFRPAGCAH